MDYPIDTLQKESELDEVHRALLSSSLTFEVVTQVTRSDVGDLNDFKSIATVVDGECFLQKLDFLSSSRTREYHCQSQSFIASWIERTLERNTPSLAIGSKCGSR